MSDEEITPYTETQYSNLTPEEQDVLQQVASHLTGERMTTTDDETLRSTFNILRACDGCLPEEEIGEDLLADKRFSAPSRRNRGKPMSNQKDYHVSWDIDLVADSPTDAARQALRIQRDPDSIATVFDVADEEGNIERIDLTAAAESAEEIS